jgi:hypothetical protein
MPEPLPMACCDDMRRMARCILPTELASHSPVSYVDILIVSQDASGSGAMLHEASESPDWRGLQASSRTRSVRAGDRRLLRVFR